jgi:trk system potassium uptake protein TrkA
MRQFAVIGLGRFGFNVAKTLSEKGHQVLGVDIDENKVQDLSEIITHAVCTDARDEKALKAAGIENVDVAIIGIGDNIEASILATLILKELGIKEIVAKAVDEDHIKVLQKVGATKVVSPEKDMGIRIANSLISPSVIEHIELSEDSSVVELIPPGEYLKKSLRDIDIRKKYGLNIIAIKKKIKVVSKGGEVKEEQKMNVAPEPDDVIREGDILIVVGTNEHIEEFKKR